MCVIIAKPAGVKMPETSTLRACAFTNPHGFGIVSPNVRYKGLDFSHFLHVAKTVSDDEPCIMHFRFATHGSIKPANCHPFLRGDVFFAHNGVLNVTPYKDKTDSETAFDKFIYPAIVEYGFDSDEMNYVINRLIGSSKFAILKGRKLRLYGNFLQDHDGCFYSNFHFKHLQHILSRRVILV